MKNSFSSRKFKGGAYTTLLSVLVILLVLLVNLVMSGVTRTKDLTGLQVYSLHEGTQDFLKDYDVPVDLYYICEVGKENKVISNTAENFAADGKDINLIYKDPVQYPQFVFQYTGKTDIDNNSIILVRRDNQDLYAYIEYEVMCLYYVNQTDLSKTLAGYNAETEILKGLVKLSDAQNANVYVATGHGEQEQLISNKGKVSSSIASLLELNSYTVKYIDLKKKAVPSDCSALLILGAIDDLSEEECTEIKDYVTGGGRVMWFLAYTGTERPNMEALLNYYGLNLEKGLLCEGDTDRTSGDHPEYILAGYGKKNTSWPNGVGLTKLASVRDSLKVEVIASTSSSAYLADDLKTMAYREGNPRGSYPLLTGISETYQGKTGKIYIFNTQYFMFSNYIGSSASYTNGEVFTTYLGELCEKESNISIPSTSAYEEALKLTTHQKNVLLVVLVGVIPGLILIAGFVMVFLRRK
ncbi:MAG: Gldg family protein [Lachnospiraceae bacterium]|nr:Gldg family protein [Lachnospiraceae bacterium]